MRRIETVEPCRELNSQVVSPSGVRGLIFICTSPPSRPSTVAAFSHGHFASAWQSAGLNPYKATITISVAIHNCFCTKTSTVLLRRLEHHAANLYERAKVRSRLRFQDVYAENPASKSALQD